MPVGLGSGICGTSLVAARRRPQTRVIGVQSDLAPSVTLSWRSGQPVETGTPRTFAEGLATRIPASMTLAMMRQLVHDMVLVTEDALRDAIRLLLRTTHNLAEGAGAASTAAALQLRAVRAFPVIFKCSINGVFGTDSITRIAMGKWVRHQANSRFSSVMFGNRSRYFGGAWSGACWALNGRYRKNGLSLFLPMMSTARSA